MLCGDCVACKGVVVALECGERKYDEPPKSRSLAIVMSKRTATKHVAL